MDISVMLSGASMSITVLGIAYGAGILRGRLGAMGTAIDELKTGLKRQHERIDKITGAENLSQFIPRHECDNRHATVRQRIDENQQQICRLFEKMDENIAGLNHKITELSLQRRTDHG